MSIRARVALISGMWLAYAGLSVTSVARHWTYVSPVIGFAGYLGCFSATSKLVTGEWPPWKRVWRAFITSGRSEFED